MEDGCDFTLIVWVHGSVCVCVYVYMCVHIGWEVWSGISESYADFTGTAGEVCVCLCTCTCKSAWMHA